MQFGSADEAQSALSLDRSTLGTRYVEINAEVQDLLRRGWARPRQVERLVGRITSRMLLLRLTLSIFDAVYAFARKVGDRHARLWPAVAA